MGNEGQKVMARGHRFATKPAAILEGMPDIQILFAAAFPLVMFAGGIAAWRLSKKDTTSPEKPNWRDDSLDDWLTERDSEAERIRLTRATEGLTTGSEEQQETKKHQQRLGG